MLHDKHASAWKICIILCFIGLADNTSKMFVIQKCRHQHPKTKQLTFLYYVNNTTDLTKDENQSHVMIHVGLYCKQRDNRQ